MDYQNGKIYKIVSENTEKIYIGSTCSPLSKRLYEHKRDCKLFEEGKRNKVSSADIIVLGNVDIILIENYPCKDKNELHARERYWIEQNKNGIVNKAIPFKTVQEKLELRDKLNEKYYEENIDAILEQKKQYYEAHKDDIKEKAKEYRAKNKDKFSESFQCECGSHYTFDSKRKHIKTKKHIKYIESKAL